MPVLHREVVFRERPFWRTAARLIAISVLAFVGLGTAFCVRYTSSQGESKEQTTALKISRYVLEAYPSWRAAHPDLRCPARLSDLDVYTSSDDTNDEWGHPLAMICVPEPVPGAHGIAVMSAGEDGKAGTCDDLESWNPKHACTD